MAELAKAIAGIFGGIVFILGGLFIYSVVATYQTGYLFAFWAPIMGTYIHHIRSSHLDSEHSLHDSFNQEIDLERS